MWDCAEGSFLKIGSSTDSTYLDRSFENISIAGIVYYILEAYNEYGPGPATDNLAVLKAIFEIEEEKISESEVGKAVEDDVVVPASRQTFFQGNYHRTDYFDFEYAQARFREYYWKEMEAFSKFQQDEMSRFEEWKKNN